MAANFYFNFDISESNQDLNSKGQKLDCEENSEVPRKVAKIIIPREKDLNVVFGNGTVVKQTQSVHLHDTPTNNYKRCLRYLSVKYVESLIMKLPGVSSCEIKEALDSHTDLIPSLYEGGLKVWECSLDLVEFLHKCHAELKLADKKLLEIGCGAGLPGIYALLNGANVHFQDYNDEVIKFFTIPNVMLNTCKSLEELPDLKIHELLQHIHKKCQFSAGDWSSMISLIRPASFDIIVTSETIYNINMQGSLYKFIKYALKPDGVVFVAAKTHYFGVGGGTGQFMDFVRKDGVFDISVVSSYSDGVKREILKMQMINSSK